MLADGKLHRPDGVNLAGPELLLDPARAAALVGSETGVNALGCSGNPVLVVLILLQLMNIQCSPEHDSLTGSTSAMAAEK